MQRIDAIWSAILRRIRLGVKDDTSETPWCDCIQCWWLPFKNHRSTQSSKWLQWCARHKRHTQGIFDTWIATLFEIVNSANQGTWIRAVYYRWPRFQEGCFTSAKGFQQLFGHDLSSCFSWAGISCLAACVCFGKFLCSNCSDFLIWWQLWNIKSWCAVGGHCARNTYIAFADSYRPFQQ